MSSCGGPESLFSKVYGTERAANAAGHVWVTVSVAPPMVQSSVECLSLDERSREGLLPICAVPPLRTIRANVESTVGTVAASKIGGRRDERRRAA